VDRSRRKRVASAKMKLTHCLVMMTANTRAEKRKTMTTLCKSSPSRKERMTMKKTLRMKMRLKKRMTMAKKSLKRVTTKKKAKEVVQEL